MGHLRTGPGLLNVKDQERVPDKELLANQQEYIDDLTGVIVQCRRHIRFLTRVVAFLAIVVLVISATLILRSAS